jgi:hypothetical protein
LLLFAIQRLRALCPTTLNSFPARPSKTFHQELTRLCPFDRLPISTFLLLHSTVHGTREAHSQVDPNSGFYDGIHNGLVMGEIEICEEAQGAQSEWQDRGDDTLEKPRSEQDRSITPECHDKVEKVWGSGAHFGGPVSQLALFVWIAVVLLSI